ncbi:unnamed protein product, partial [Discosporangium mesarthrocarpum]
SDLRIQSTSDTLSLLLQAVGNMKSVAPLVIMAGSAGAFVTNMAPLRASVSGGVSTARTSLSMNAMEGLVGADIEAPYFDPFNFARNCPPEQMQYYRAAELKHGRISMLAALGQIVQSYTHFDDPVFSQSDKPWAAMQQQRPIAFVQIFLAIFAAEVYGAMNQEKSPMGGDLNFDPLNLRPSNPEAWEKTQLRELKNGRLAMLAIAGMITQEHVTGMGVIEAIRAG